MKTPLALVAMLLFTASGFAFDQRKLSPKICGSVEQYEQERIWENLPGCVNVSANRCESGNNNCINYGGRAVTWEDDTGAFKAQFMTFYNAWDSGDYEGAESAASIIGSNLRDLVRDVQAGRVRPSKSLREAYGRFDHHLQYINALNAGYGQVKELMEGISQNYMRIDNSLGESRDRLAQIAASAATHQLKQMLDRADKAKIPEGWVIAGTQRQQPISLADLRKQVSQWQGTSDQQLGAIDAREKAKWAAYDAVVKGDRIPYLEHFKKGTIIFGRGGVRISTPEEFKSATAMFYCLGSDPRQATPTWEIRGGYFQGDKQTSSYTDTGVGTTCPTRAYK